MTSVAPWPASKEAIELYKILKPLGDLEQWRFEDWRNKAVLVNDKDCFSAVYSRQGQAYILLANTTAENKNVRCVVRPGQLSYPLKGVKSAEIIGKGSNVKLDAEKLFSRGEIVTIGADDVTMIHIE